MPSAASRSTTPNRCSGSGSRVVTSSRISSRGSLTSALASSTSSREPCPSAASGISGSRWPSPTRSRNGCASAAMEPRRTRWENRCSLVSNTFSATDSDGTLVGSCATMATPTSSASFGLAKEHREPSTSRTPASGSSTPATTFDSVDLPLPFSPQRATTSPARTSRSTSTSARTGPKDLEIPWSRSSGAA